MSPARIIILVVALAAGLGAALLIQRPRQTQAVTRFEPAPTVDVLVAAADIPLGNMLKAGDTRWLAWPAASVPAGVVRRDQNANGADEFNGQIARAPFVASEPIRSEKLIRTDGTGFLSAVLPAGMRAVAISTDSRGANTAGGFILPNDRVDVILTTRARSDDDKGGTPAQSETILVNVRVLAIGQNVQERNGEKVVVGETATLELEPRQAEIVALAQTSGKLSLALRSLQDAKETAKAAEDSALTIVRYGVSTRGSN